MGAFSDYVPFTYLKLITILGFVFTAIITLYALRSDPFTYLTVVILSILAFRYNTHPQYLLWPLPFLMLSRGIPSSFLYSVVTATLIILNLTFWHSNSSAYAFLELFELSIFADLELAIGQNYADSLLRYLFQAILIFYLLYLIEFHYIKKAFKKALEYFLALIKNINYNRLSLFICLLFLLVYLNRSNIFSENLLYALRVLLINYAPVILVSVLLSSRILANLAVYYYFLFLGFFVSELFKSFNNINLEFLNWSGSLFFILFMLHVRPILDRLEE